MNILYLCADPGIAIRGHKGSAVHVRALSDAMVALGHQVTLLTPRAGPADGAPTSARVIEVECGPSPADRELAGREAAEALWRAARARLSAGGFDAIYERYSLWSDAGARLAQEFGLPLVVEINAPLRLEAARYRTLTEPALAADLEQRLLAGAHAIAVVSEPLRAHVLELGVPAERVHVLPNAVDERAFNPLVDGRAVRQQLGLAGRFVVGFVGTVRPWHDLDTLLDALAMLRASSASTDGVAYRLLLVGSIPGSVHDAIGQRGLAGLTTIIEPVPHADVPQYIAAMDVAVSPHPPLSDFYYSPLKLFEYLACGTPTIAADLPPLAAVAAHGETALLYPPGNAAALAAAIARLAADAGLRDELGRRGADLVRRRHTWRRNAERVLGWMQPAAAAVHATVTGPTLPIRDEVLGESLLRATRRDLAEPLLGDALARAGAGQCGTLARLAVLKYKPRRRCVIQYEMHEGRRDADSAFGELVKMRTHRLIGKVFKDERGAGQYALHQALWNDGFDAEARDGIGVPKPIAYIPELRMFLQAHASGETLDAFVRAPEFAERVRSSALAIAKLHASRVTPAKSYRVADEMTRLAQAQQTLAQQRPAGTDRWARYMDALRQIAQALPPAVLAPAHRDFYYTQLIFDGRRVNLIDLDLFAGADRALDVGNFAAHLRFLALQSLHDAGALDPARDAFVDAYAQCARPGDGFRQRLAFYEAATYFRLLSICVERAEFNAYADAMRAMLDRALPLQPALA